MSLLPKLIDLDAKYARAEEVKVLEVGSFSNNNRRSFFVAFESCHANPADFQVGVRPDQSISISPANEPASQGGYIVVRSTAPVCNEPLCQTRCRKCPQGGLCVHAFQCTCPQFTDERYCVHLHVAISVSFVGEKQEDPMTLHRRMVVPDSDAPVQDNNKGYLSEEEERSTKSELQTMQNKHYLEKKKRALSAIRKLTATVKASGEEDCNALERVAGLVDQLTKEFNSQQQR